MTKSFGCGAPVPFSVCNVVVAMPSRSKRFAVGKRFSTPYVQESVVPYSSRKSAYIKNIRKTIKNADIFRTLNTKEIM